MLDKSSLKKALLALLPIPLVLLGAFYLARESVQNEVEHLLTSTISVADALLLQVEIENRTALIHPERCEELQQNLMYERDIDEMLIVQDGMIICSSKLGSANKPLAEYVSFPPNQKLAFGRRESMDDVLLLVISQGEENYQVVTIIDRDYFGVTIGFNNDLRLKRSALFIGDQAAPQGVEKTGSNPIATKSSNKFEYGALIEASDQLLNQRFMTYLVYSGPIILAIYLLLYTFYKWLDPRRNLVVELKRAIQKGDLTLDYQPQIDAGSGKVFGYEALIRWKHQQKGFISPDEFVPAAEQSGLVSLLTDYVLDKAVEDFSKLNFTRTIHLGVNVPPAYLLGSQVIRKIQLIHRKLSHNNVALGIEITERQLIGEEARKRIAALRMYGIDVLIDDFGTGRTTLASLQHMRIDYLKIDKCFVETIGIQSVSASALNTIIHFAEQLDVKLIAEGVETPAQAAHLKKLGVQYHQGYLYSKPLSYNQLAQYRLP